MFSKYNSFPLKASIQQGKTTIQLMSAALNLPCSKPAREKGPHPQHALKYVLVTSLSLFSGKVHYTKRR